MAPGLIQRQCNLILDTSLALSWKKEDVDDIIIKFTLWGISVGVNVRNQGYEELDILPVCDITSPLFWYPKSKLHAENEVSVQQGEEISKRKWVVMVIEEPREGETWRVNLSSVWEYSKDNILIIVYNSQLDDTLK